MYNTRYQDNTRDSRSRRPDSHVGRRHVTTDTHVAPRESRDARHRTDGVARSGSNKSQRKTRIDRRPFRRDREAPYEGDTR